MTPMRETDIEKHQKNILRLQKKKIRVRGKYLDGKLSRVAYYNKLEEVDVESRAYIIKSGVILFYGKYFKVTT